MICFNFSLIRAAFLSGFKNIILIFTIVRTTFLILYKMLENENNPDNYKTLKISIRAIIKIQKC